MKREEYIERLCRKIRNKAARQAFREELNDHIDEKMRELMKEGKSADEAERAAIESMGDAEQIAQGMNRATVAWYDIAKYIFLAVVGYMIIYLVLYMMRPGNVGMILGEDGPSAIYYTVRTPLDIPLIIGLICVTVVLFAYSIYKKKKRTE